MGDMKNAHNILAENPEGKISHGKIRRRWECNTELNFKEIRNEGL
jgi:hypothetical protein